MRRHNLLVLALSASVSFRSEVVRLAASGAALIVAVSLVSGCMTGRDRRPPAQDYSTLETNLISSGLFRTETAPEDALYDADDLALNFERVALYHQVDATLITDEHNWDRNPLQRWESPIRYRLFGDAVTPEDRAEVARLIDRIIRLTGLEIAEAKEDVNFDISITTPEERAAYRRFLGKAHLSLAEAFDLWRRTPKVICASTNLMSKNNENVITFGLVVIGSESDGLLRKACLHEMIAKALGLSNGHPDVRPSIFNDDGEFALLTEHDEHLLRILYDPRLEPGMPAVKALPIVRQIAAEIMPAASAAN